MFPSWGIPRELAVQDCPFFLSDCKGNKKSAESGMTDEELFVFNISMPNYIA